MIEIKVLASSSSGNCYRVTDGSTPLLLEAGIRIDKIKKGLNYRLSEVEGCLITHEHKDHSKEVGKITGMGINCYMSKGTAYSITVKNRRIRTLTSLRQFKIGTWTILPFDVQHDATEPLGYLLANREGDKLLFATDTYYIKYKFQGLTHIMLECNYEKSILEENLENGVIDLSQKLRIQRSHFSLANVKEFLRSNDLSKVEEIHLLHLSSRNSDSELFKREIQKTTGKEVYIASQM